MPETKPTMKSEHENRFTPSVLNSSVAHFTKEKAMAAHVAAIGISKQRGHLANY